MKLLLNYYENITGRLLGEEIFIDNLESLLNSPLKLKKAVEKRKNRYGVPRFL